MKADTEMEAQSIETAAIYHRNCILNGKNPGNQQDKREEIMMGQEFLSRTLYTPKNDRN